MISPSGKRIEREFDAQHSRLWHGHLARDGSWAGCPCHSEDTHPTKVVKDCEESGLYFVEIIAV